MVRQLGAQREIERTAGFLLPEQVVLRQSFRVGDRGRQIEAPVRVDGELPAGSGYRQHRFDAPQVLIFEKSMYALRIFDLIVFVSSRMSTIFMTGDGRFGRWSE
jgi:hypothetical protein